MHHFILIDCHKKNAQNGRKRPVTSSMKLCPQKTR